MTPDAAESDAPAVAPATPDAEKHERPACTVVGIGASAGGLKAFTKLLSHLPAQTGLAFVLIQHLDPVHESQLTQLLAVTTRLPVIEATDGLMVEPDHVYVIPPNVSMTHEHGALRLAPRADGPAPHLPVDIFFRSLAQHSQNHAIGVLLSGTGSDGTVGIGEIKAAGGITFAQDEQSAEYASMPQSAIASGSIDFVIPPDQIARELVQIGRHPYLRPTPTAQSESEAEGIFEQILSHLRTATGVDFSEYRPTTMKRRIARRMALHKHESHTDYLRLLQSNPAEIDSLYRDMLINVTSFFRDPDVFEALKTTVFPQILKGKSAENPVRIWVPGCSTGQEAYSIAMALLEFLDQHGAPPAIQIFGTDINDEAAVEKARPGVYPPSIEAEVSPGRLQRFFIKVDGGYRIGKAIRDLCVFARQDVTSDPPFSRLDLISCRNLLIYLAPALQHRIIPTFHYALNPDGFLLLGPAETVGKFSDLFERIDRPHNLFARRASPTRPYPFLVGGSFPLTPQRGGTPPAEPVSPIGDLRREADRIIMNRFAPAAVLIDENLEILQFRGNTAPYLQAPSGHATHNILKMVRDSLFLDLRTTIDQAKKQNTTARRNNIRLPDDQGVRWVNVEASPLRRAGSDQRCILVLFMDAPSPAAAAAPGSPAPSPQAAPVEDPGLRLENSELRQELASVKEYLQAIIEQQNAANEELQSANEEIRSTNEELQTNNEEMQTSREELQSTNEELRTVNDELQSRNQETSRLSDDLNNTLASIKLPIVILGSDLRIRRFTAAAGTLLNLIPADVGRPFANIKSPFDIPNHEALLLEVMASVTVQELEVQDSIGRWFNLAMHPYRTDDRRIDGVVLVLRDITKTRHDAEQLLAAQHAAEASSRAKDHFLAVLSHELRTPLTPVLATVALLQRDQRFDADTHENLEVIRRNAEIEALLIDDLLDVTRITQGKVQLDKRPVALDEILQRAIEVCQPDITLRRLDFSIEADQPRSLIAADATRMQQVFWNLLRNAVKFTPPGGQIVIRSRRQNGHVVVDVRDTGEGIRPEVLPRLFKIFEQGGIETTRHFGGLGLGLVISKGIVEMHGGTIKAQSAGPGQGATFTVRLPLLSATDAASVITPPVRTVLATPRPLHILLVEDHGDTARVMERLLTADGHTVQTVGDMASALPLVTSRAFDLLLSDVGLPDGSGLELMRAIRAKGLTLPGIALSGFGQRQDVQQCLDAGFAAHLTKPIDLRRLAEAMSQAVSDNSPASRD